MYISSTVLQAKPGRGADVGAAAVKLGSLASKAGHSGVATWRFLTGSPYGSFLISGRSDTLAGLVDSGGKIASDPEFAALSAQLGDALLVPAEPFINRVVTASPSYAPKPFMSLTLAVATGGKMGAAMELIMEVMAFIEKVAGVGMAVTTPLGGALNQIGTILSTDDAASYEAAVAKLLGDPGWMVLMDKVGELVEPGTSKRAYLVQIA